VNRHCLVRWLGRYAPPEGAAILGALLGALVGAQLGGAVGGAVGGTVGEGLAFYAVVVVRELRSERAAAAPRSLHQVLVDLLVEFGPAEALDSLLVRPLAMYAGPMITGDLLGGTVAGKVFADLVFYALAAFAFEQRRARRTTPDPEAA
jgi:uncharacterized protein (DUF2062 family)